MKTRTVLLLCGVVFLGGAAVCQAQDVESDWNDFLHYTMIGRFDLAQGYAQRLIEGDPDPLKLLELSESNPEGYRVLLKIYDDSDELRELAGQILDIIEKGRYERRTDPKIITGEIARLSTTIRGKIAAQERLKNAGEFAIPYMLVVLNDPSRRDEFANIVETLPMIGRSAIRPLGASLQTENVAVKTEIIRALGKIGYFQSLPYLKYEVENAVSEDIRQEAQMAIDQIDSQQGSLPAAELFFMLAEMYYDNQDSVAAPAEFDFANVWFWDENKQVAMRFEVSPEYFNELMAMRTCEWALKADAGIGKAIGLWLASFFRAESYGIEMPEYFGAGHADAMTYAVTAGPEYLHLALARALSRSENYVALQVVEAMAVNAGSQALLERVGTEMPLAQALQYEDRKVRYSAAIALGQANPTQDFTGSSLIVENLAAAVRGDGADELGQDLADAYSMRAMKVFRKLAISRNSIVRLSDGLEALIGATMSDRSEMQVLAFDVLVRLTSPEAQRAIAAAAMNEQNDKDVRLAAFGSLADSAKVNANLLLSEQIDAMYELIQLRDADADLRQGAAGAYGALNLPSQRVKDLILDQAKS